MKNRSLEGVLIILFILFTAFSSCDLLTETDNTPPQISITEPAVNAILKGTVTIKTNVTDNKGVSKVEFYIDNHMVARIKKRPFYFEWNTIYVVNGFRTIQCKAFDKAGNSAWSESVQVKVNNPLFTAAFEDGWLRSGCQQAILYVSDSLGRVLAETKWTGGPANLELTSGPGMTNLPRKINVTTVEFYDENRIYFTTDMNIPAGSSWKWKKKNYTDYTTPLFTTTLNFKNIPQHKGYVLSGLGYSRSAADAELSSATEMNFYKRPSDLLVMLGHIENGQKYLWINDVNKSAYTVDLDTLKKSAEKSITLPGQALNYKYYFYGFPVPGSRGTGSYLINRVTAPDTLTAQIKVYLPGAKFSDYRTSLYYYDSQNSNDFWYQSVYGNIPAKFTKIKADFDFLSVIPDNFSVQPSGDFDEIRSIWHYSSGNLSWYIYGPDDLNSYALPPLPYALQQLAPAVSRQDFNLNYADLVDHSELGSYEEILDIVFQSDDYFYDVVHDFRSRKKSPQSAGNAAKMRTGEALIFERDYDLPYGR